MNDDRSRLWWNEIAGPSGTITSIVRSLLQAQSVVLFVPEDLPWRRQMRNAVEQSLRQENDSLQVSYVDCLTDCDAHKQQDGSIDIPNYLIQRFGLADSYNGYRKSSRITIQEYIINNDILRDRIVWVKGLNGSQVKGWIEFCRKYNSNRNDKGLFVIESYHDYQIPSSPNLCRIQYAVSYYDALLYNNMIVSSANLSMEWKQYIATLSAQLCGEDVELSVAIMNSGMLSSVNPILCLSSVAKSTYFENRYSAQHLRSDHPFALMKIGDNDSMANKVWESQLRTLYPLLEMERVAFIESYEEAVREGIGCEYYDLYRNRRHIRQYGEILTNPYDAEIGTLYRMNCLRRADDESSFVLYLPNEEDRIRLSLLHDMRNAIAHAKVCPIEQVADFLNNHPYKW